MSDKCAESFLTTHSGSACPHQLKNTFCQSFSLLPAGGLLQIGPGLSVATLVPCRNGLDTGGKPREGGGNWPTCGPSKKISVTHLKLLLRGKAHCARVQGMPEGDGISLSHWLCSMPLQTGHSMRAGVGCFGRTAEDMSARLENGTCGVAEGLRLHILCLL